MLELFFRFIKLPKTFNISTLVILIAFDLSDQMLPHYNENEDAVLKNGGDFFF